MTDASCASPARTGCPSDNALRVRGLPFVDHGHHISMAGDDMREVDLREGIASSSWGNRLPSELRPGGRRTRLGETLVKGQALIPVIRDHASAIARV